MCWTLNFVTLYIEEKHHQLLEAHTDATADTSAASWWQSKGWTWSRIIRLLIISCTQFSTPLIISEWSLIRHIAYNPGSPSLTFHGLEWKQVRVRFGWNISMDSEAVVKQTWLCNSECCRCCLRCLFAMRRRRRRPDSCEPVRSGQPNRQKCTSWTLMVM